MLSTGIPRSEYHSRECSSTPEHAPMASAKSRGRRLEPHQRDGVLRGKVFLRCPWLDCLCYFQGVAWRETIVFKAVKSSKIRVRDGLGEFRLASVIKPNEGFLTAAVFARLLYLPSDAFAARRPVFVSRLGKVQESALIQHAGGS